jgi:putative flippase GtrA
MGSFFKAQASSLMASAADFTATVVLKEAFQVYFLTASVLGTITGGLVNFLVNRNWVFDAKDKHEDIGISQDLSYIYHEKNKPVGIQAFRYGLVWTGNLGLNAAGVYLLTHYGGISYMISKIFVSVVVGFSYNYLLQKRFVFSKA